MSAGRVAALVAANLKMLLRNRVALFFLLALPIVFMVLFGLIFGGSGSSRQDVELVGSGPLVQALERSGTVKIHPAATAEQAVKRVRDGDADGALILHGGRGTLYYDAASTVGAAQLRGVVGGTAAAVSLRATGKPPAVVVDARPVQSQNLDYIDYLVPGLLAMALSQSAVFGVAGAMVSFRERGIFRRLRLTPLPLSEFTLARILSQLALGVIQAVVLLGVGRLAFGVHFLTNPLLLLPLVAGGVLCFITIGFLVGAFARNQDSADAIANVVTLPMVFLAGVFFPLDQAPAWLAGVAKALPLTYLANGLRDLAVRGHSFASTLPDLGVLLGASVVLAALAMRFFRWEST